MEGCKDYIHVDDLFNCSCWEFPTFKSVIFTLYGGSKDIIIFLPKMM